MKYKKCPRCEINYIPVDDDYCEICKKELKGQLVFDIIDEEEIDYDAEGICPRCKTNYVADGEKYCHQCLVELESNNKRISDLDEPDEWAKLDTDDETLDLGEDLEEIEEIGIDEETELSLENLAEQEGWNDEEEEEEEEEFYQSSDDDFEELDVDLDSDEFDDEEDEDFLDEDED